jgi:hypothetical protein
MDETQEPQLAHDNSESPSEEAGSPAGDTDSIGLAGEAPLSEGVVADSAESPASQPDSSPEPDLLGELATAMHAAAARERERLEAAIGERSVARIEDLRARASVETDELRRMADVDVHRIDGWAAAEIDRIRFEARRRSDERRSALDEYVNRHDVSVEAEIGRVGRAVAVYRERIDAFFSEVEATTDPATIARLAGSVPALPDLDDLPDEVTTPTHVNAEAPSVDAEGPGGDAERPSDEAAATTAETEASAEAYAELEAASDERLQEPLVGVMASASPAPVSPLTAIVSAPPTIMTTSPDEEPRAVAEEPSEPAVALPEAHHRGAFGLLRTITPWSRHDDRDAAAGSSDSIPEGNRH